MGAIKYTMNADKKRLAEIDAEIMKLRAKEGTKIKHILRRIIKDKESSNK